MMLLLLLLLLLLLPCRASPESRVPLRGPAETWASASHPWVIQVPSTIAKRTVHLVVVL